MQNLQTFSTSFMSLHAPFMLFMFRLSSTALPAADADLARLGQAYRLRLKPMRTTHDAITRDEDHQMADTTRKSAEQNQLEGKAKEIGGKIRGKVGDITDNRSEQLKGKKDEIKGRAQKKLGDAERDVKDLDETL